MGCFELNLPDYDTELQSLMIHIWLVLNGQSYIVKKNVDWCNTRDDPKVLIVAL